MSLKIDYKSELNPAQYKAVTSIDGPMLVIAGAGSGKTRTLVYRVAYLCEKGVDPSSILLLTFTRKASQEMMRRATSILDNRCSLVRGGTFHSFSNVVLRKYAPKIGYRNNFSIVDRDDAESIINLLRSQRGFDKEKRRFPTKGTILNVISKSINTGKSYVEILQEEYPQFIDEEFNINALAEDYDIYKCRHSIMDYDDLLTNFLRLLKEHDPIRERLSRECKYILVDEYQDTNRIQAEIACLLASEHENIMVVGDDAQSIYSFRGANFKNIMDFPKIFPTAGILPLEQNYRSSKPILSLANAITENARERFTKNLFCERDSDSKPELVTPIDEDEQSAFICDNILELRESGVPLNEIAVLFRSAWVSNSLEVDLSVRNIPFVKYGGIKFIEAAHIKDLLSILRVAVNPEDTIAWNRILLMLPGIGGKTAQNIVNMIVEQRKGYEGLRDPSQKKKKHYPALEKLYHLLLEFQGADEIATDSRLRQVIDYYRPILEQKYDDFKKRAEDLESFVHISSRYNNLVDFITSITLESPETGEIGGTAKDKERLILSTIHSAKGLEWHSVFLMSLVEGVLPSFYSVKKAEEIEEERRLFYVAVTRAKEKLFLLTPEYLPLKSYYDNYQQFSRDSRFLTEISNLEQLVEKREIEDPSLSDSCREPAQEDVLEETLEGRKERQNKARDRIMHYFSKN